MNALADRVLVITDRHQARRPLAEVVGDAVEAGARWIWLRERDLAAGERRRLAFDLLRIARSAGARLTIGADPALAAEIGADGVHLPAAEPVGWARRRLGPQALIGVSAHSIAEVERAAGDGADYTTLSPIFASPSKPGYGPRLGLESISAAAWLGIPVLALGGVSAENAEACRAAGAAGIAVMGAVMRADRPGEIYQELAEAMARRVPAVVPVTASS